ncbi:hypothetical protein IG193_08955 [Infirmifilum lucidum]|uniref:Uncharacterized protein n=1 Tax=Infirmifilum lucidum TaxID=2776706 RepID=A0A7L9FIY3_9CREN|nr:hypothetical protein [Infirmifilum lucidum]QOJ78856.1 hypothetical protein IG193_08955 [Infirmifilum lucidum]
MRHSYLLALILVSLVALDALPQHVGLEVAWRRISAEGVAYSACTGKYVYVVGYEGSGANTSARVEALNPADGSLVKSYTYRGARVFYSCAYARGRLLAAGVTSEGRWVVASFADDLSPQAAVTSVAGYAASLATDGEYLYVAGVDASTASVRVEKRELGTLSLVAAYSPGVPNTNAYSCTHGGDSIWLAGSALTPSGFKWRVERLATNLSSQLRLRPEVGGHAFSVAYSGGLVYVTGPNGTAVFDASGAVLARTSTGGYGLALLNGTLVLYTARVEPLLLLLNSTTLDLLATLELSQGRAVPSFGSVALQQSTLYIAGAEEVQGKAHWAVYAVRALRPQVNATKPPASAPANATSTPQAVQPQQPLAVFLPEAVASIAMVAGIVAAVVAIKRGRKKKQKS